MLLADTLSYAQLSDAFHNGDEELNINDVRNLYMSVERPNEIKDRTSKDRILCRLSEVITVG